MRNRFLCLALLGAGLWLPAEAQVAVTITPSQVDVHIGTFLQFASRVTGTTNTSVAWTVSLPPGATGSPGAINNTGRYTPPAAAPVPNVVLVKVTSNADATASATATVDIVNPYPSVASVAPNVIPPGTFGLTVNGSNFVSGAQVFFGTTALPTIFVSSTKVIGTVTASQAQLGQSFPITVVNPDPGSAVADTIASVTVSNSSGGPARVSFATAARFLDQAAFGPDYPTIAHVQQVGLEGWIDEQFNAPISHYPDPARTAFDVSRVQARFFTNAVHGQDQLRQRVSFALGQIFVVSAVMENSAAQLAPYEELLQRDAFSDFAILMWDVTVSPTMGEYLSMLNNDKANAAKGTKANENYARELLQLFTIGLFQLNQDGSLKRDSSGQPIPTYTQNDIAEFARVLTGWTYPTKPGATLQIHNPANYDGSMVPFESNHDNGSKTYLGFTAPAGLTAQQDLNLALQHIFGHPNVGPFIAKNLIQHLVTSNPSPAYVSRVAAVFNENGAGVRGDMKAVVKAILLDPEARAGDSDSVSTGPNTSGHLREPVFFIASALRGLQAQVNDTNGLTARAAALNQTIFAPASVFNYYSPGYRIPAEFTPGLSLGGPEFQLESPATAVGRANLANTIAFTNMGAGTVVDLTPYVNLASNTGTLVDGVSNTFFYGRMPWDMHQKIVAALNATTDRTARARTAIYLALSSNYYNVEH